MSRWRLTFAALLVLTAFVPAAPADEAAPAPLLLILDASGSMWGQIDGENKIVIARRVLGEVVDGLADGSEAGLVAYGHRREGDCEDIETVVPLGTVDKGALKATVDGINPKGKTPITRSVEEAFGLLADREGGATVVLLSDGVETCGGDPCGAVRAARERGIDFVMHVVGFDVAGEDVSQLECAAQAGDGLFFSAENAGELSAALESAVAMPVEVPAGRLAVKAVADGELQDVSVTVLDPATGDTVTGGRTYRDPSTNPRSIPLADGRYDVEVMAVGLRGDVRREFQIEIAEGSLVEREVDYSTGELAIGVTRNGELSDAVYRVRVAGSSEEVAGGRTYTSEARNPAKVRLTAGDYEVTIGSVEIEGKPEVALGPVEIAPKGQAEVAHEFVSGELSVKVARGDELVDAVLRVYGASGQVAGGRTYTSPGSNPKRFVLPPGEYRVSVGVIRGEEREIEVRVEAGGSVEQVVDLGSGG